ncbi:Scr1 family TA system antitoxin-like transcriptional regulator [Nocardiopsis tropica]|uniref:Scr1 family TA system antitoxin-like transcriptional regulator n=1 Tax=Nocardiopsis tropica TaxID=109330 RepID=A0ABV1ZYS0_9ACTN
MILTPFQEDLIKFRELAGLTQRQLADRSQTSHSSVNRWERGTGTPKRDNVALLDSALGAQGVLLAAWRRTTEGTGLPDWARDLESIERTARHLTAITPAMVPGLLQCPAVARAVFRAGLPGASPGDLARLVALRTERLKELPDMDVTAVFPAAAVAGLPADLRQAQAVYLLEWAATGRVSLHLVPQGATLLVPASPLMLFRLGTGDLAVVSDHADGNVIHEDTSHDRLSGEVTAALAASLPVGLSLDELRKMT